MLLFTVIQDLINGENPKTVHEWTTIHTTHSHCEFLKPFTGWNSSHHLEKCVARVCAVDSVAARARAVNTSKWTLSLPLTHPQITLCGCACCYLNCNISWLLTIYSKPHYQGQLNLWKQQNTIPENNLIVLCNLKWKILRASDIFWLHFWISVDDHPYIQSLGKNHIPETDWQDAISKMNLTWV